MTGLVVVDRGELLALLEPGPQTAGQLAEWLNAPRMRVTSTLGQMATEGLVRQRGSSKTWVVAGYVMKTGRKPTVDLQALRAGVQAALADGALKTEQLVPLLGIRRTVLRHRCAQMVAAGELKRVGTGPNTRWALVSYEMPPATLPAPRSHAKKPRPKPEGHAVPANQLLGENGARLYPRDKLVLDDGTLLRQPGSGTQASQTVKKDETLSWWCNLSRSQLSAEARARMERMRWSKEAKFVLHRILA